MCRGLYLSSLSTRARHVTTGNGIDSVATSETSSTLVGTASPSVAALTSRAMARMVTLQRVIVAGP